MIFELIAQAYIHLVLSITSSQIFPIIAAIATILAHNHLNLSQSKIARRYSYAVIASNSLFVFAFLIYLNNPDSPMLANMISQHALTPIVLTIYHLVYYWGVISVYHIYKMFIQ